MRLHVAMAACMLVAACGSGNDEAASGEAGPAAEAAAPASTSDDAKMRAALAKPCEFLTGDMVAAAAGTGVDMVSPLPATKADDVDAVCMYGLTDGGNAQLDITYNFVSPGYFSADEIASRRDIAEGTARAGKKLEDVAGLGDAAYYDPNRKQLTVYRGGAEQAIFQASRRNDAGDPKAITTAMAKAAGY